MKVKLSDIYNSIESLNKLMQVELPITVSYKLVKLLKKLNEEIGLIEQSRIKLVKKYSPDGKDENVAVPEDKRDEFFKEFAELLTTEVTLNFEPISVSSLPNLNMSVNELGKIHYIFKD